MTLGAERVRDLIDVALFLSLPGVLVLAWLVSRLLGVRRSWTTTLVSGVLGWIGGVALSLAIAGQRNDPSKGFIQITDRAKDVIKSGGEWISSVEIENLLMAHPDVVEAAVIGVPDPRWSERPLACVVCKPGASVDANELRGFLADKLARWQLPERWTFIDEVPKTSVGKFDKKVLRARHGAHELEIQELTET